MYYLKMTCFGKNTGVIQVHWDALCDVTSGQWPQPVQVPGQFWLTTAK